MLGAWALARAPFRSGKWYEELAVAFLPGNVLALGTGISRRLHDMGPVGAVVWAALLSVACLLVMKVAEVSVDAVFSAAGIPSRMEGILAQQETYLWIDVLVVSPVVENAFCLLWLGTAFSGKAWAGWKGPLAVGTIAAVLHMLVYLEPRYVAILVLFFPVCYLIANVRRRRVGFVASVLLHSGYNYLAMIDWT